MRRFLKVGLLFHSFSNSNLGVGALAISECELLKRICDKLNIELEIICFEAKVNDLYSSATEAFVNLKQTTYNPFRMIKYLNDCNLIIDATAGDSFTDIYGLKNFIRVFLIKYYSILAKPSIVLAPQTIGPYRSNITKVIADIYLCFVKKIFIRDELSKAAIPTRIMNKVTVSTDMAFVLPFRRTKTLKAKSKIVGFNISGLLYSGGFNLNRNDDFSYRRLCLNIIDLLIKEGYEVYLVPHVVGGIDDSKDNDTKVTIDLCKNDLRLKMAPLFKDPIEAKSYISQFDLFIGSRMHATIAAFSSGVLTIPLAYSRKFKGVFEPLGYRTTLDLQYMSENEIIDQIKYILVNEKTIKSNIENTTTVVTSRLSRYEAYLEKVILKKIDELNYKK
jgi:polysaccharide pyruvyl transferase WcaK-like protein